MKVLKSIRNKCLDLFFSSPYIFDFLFALGITSLSYILTNKYSIDILSLTNLDRIASDVSSSCITIAGFVLTILTIVISFKNSSDSKNEFDSGPTESTNKSKIDLFFSSELYFKTVKVLQQSITGLVFVFAFFIFIVLFDKSINQDLKFYTLIFGITLAILIFSRCILTLKLIIKLQMSNDKNKKDSVE